MTNENTGERGPILEKSDSEFTDPTLQEDSDAAEEQSEAEAQRQAALQASIRKNLEQALKELEEGTLHGLAIVRVNKDHEVAGGYSVCGEAAHALGLKMRDMSIELSLPPEAAREVKQLIGMLRAAMR